MDFDAEARRKTGSGRVTMKLLRLAGAIKQMTLAESGAAGLTPVQAQSLLFIRSTKSFAASVGNLAAALGTTHATAVGVVNGLIARGWVGRETSPRDRRVSLLRLTAEGECACERLASWAEALERSINSLSPETIQSLEHDLCAIVHSLRDAGYLPVAEPCRGCRYFRENAAPGADEPHYCALIDGYLSEAESRRDCPDFAPPLRTQPAC
jgi:DNA-binding MarR family transcriptional regulator